MTPKQVLHIACIHLIILVVSPHIQFVRWSLFLVTMC